MSSSGSSTTDPVELGQSLLDIYEGFTSTKYLALACFSLLIFDHLICLDQEVEYFWVEKWNCTRALYFLNRYIPPWVFIVQFIYFFNSSVSLKFCTIAIRTTTAFVVCGVFIVEAVLVLRVYYLWTHNRAVQYFNCLAFTVAAVIAIIFAGKAINLLEGVRPLAPLSSGCINQGGGLYWPIFLPIFVIQNVLFLCTLLRILRPMRLGTNKPVVNRLLRDGSFFYLVVCLSAAFTGIGSLEVNHPKIASPALVSNAILAIHSICASHLILSIHSLAEDLGSEPTFLLSNVEISRLVFRVGSNANELVVEVDPATRPYAEEPREYIDLHPLSLKKSRFKRAMNSPTSTTFNLESKGELECDDV